MIVEDTTEDMVDVKISIMKICPYTLQEKSLQQKKSISQNHFNFDYDEKQMHLSMMG